jgi:hypothetical protein
MEETKGRPYKMELPIMLPASGLSVEKTASS